MCYMVEQHLVHRDLAARNIFVCLNNGRFSVRIADFGMTRNVSASNVYQVIRYVTSSLDDAMRLSE